MISPADHNELEEGTEQGTEQGFEDIAEVVLRRSIVGSTSWRLGDSCNCLWCSIWQDCVVNGRRGSGDVGLTRS
jgi:hypothetical protein